MQKRFSNIIGFDDAPFLRDDTGDVKIIGTIYARLQLNGVLMGDVKKDGDNSAQKLISIISNSRFAETIQLIMLQGITLAGFNVVDVFEMHDRLKIPILVVSRKIPDLTAVKDALTHVRGGKKKWAVIERLGPMEPVEKIYVQRLGLTIKQAASVVRNFTVTGHIPEPLRVAHLIAGAIINGESRGRV